MKRRAEKPMTAEQLAATTFEPIQLDDSKLEARKWAERSRKEGAAVRLATAICQQDDKTLKARVNGTNAQEFADLHEMLLHWQKTYEAGVELMQAATVRLLVVLSHWETTRPPGKAARRRA